MNRIVRIEPQVTRLRVSDWWGATERKGAVKLPGCYVKQTMEQVKAARAGRNCEERIRTTIV